LLCSSEPEDGCAVSDLKPDIRIAILQERLFIDDYKQNYQGIHMAKLENRVGVITTSNSEIGLATAGEFVTEGAHVFIMG
jgi:hypothetical protein